MSLVTGALTSVLFADASLPFGAVRAPTASRSLGAVRTCALVMSAAAVRGASGGVRDASRGRLFGSGRAGAS